MKSQPEMKLVLSAMALFALPVMIPAAQAEDYRPNAGDVTLRAGPAGIFFDSSAKFKMLGVDLPGADLKASNGFTASLEAEVYVIPEVSLSLTVGIPPKSKVDGKGILAPAGRLGSVRYGLGSAFAKYHMNQSSPLQPFVAVGAAHFVSFKEHDAAVTGLKVDGSWGLALQAGADYMLTPHVGIYGSVAHAFLKTDGSGTFGGAPVTADVKLNPTVLQGGVLFRF